MNPEKPRHQIALTYGSWVLTGLMALGGLLQAVGIARELITPAITYVGTALVILCLVSFQGYLKKHGLDWFADSSVTRIRGLNLGLVLPFLGMVVLLWVPRLVPAEEPKIVIMITPTPDTASSPKVTPTHTLTQTPMATPTSTSELHAASSSTPALSPTPPEMATATQTPTPIPPRVMPEEGSLIHIVQHYPAPGRRTEGITWDGTDLWLSDNSGTIFQVNILGNTLGAFQSPDVTPKGLAWDGSSLWVFTTNYLSIYQFQIEGQETKPINSFESPAKVVGGNITNDLAWDGENLWYANQYNVYRLDTSGEELGSFAFPKNVMGLDWDGSNLWLAYNDFPSTSTLVVVDVGGRTVASFSSPVFEIEGLAWGDGCLWAVGRDSLAGESRIYKLDVSLASDVVTPPSDMTWQAHVLSVRESPTLEDTRIGGDGVPQYFQYHAGEGRTFVVVELGLKSQALGAALVAEDISVTDEQGHAYSPVGIRKNVAPVPDEFGVGSLAGLITMSHLEPPVLTFEYEIKGVMGSSISTMQGEMPISSSSGEWPALILVWLIPTDARGLQLAVPGVPSITLEEWLSE